MSHSTDGTTLPADTLMQRLALARLRRFERVAAVAERSESEIWQRLARQAARNAMRDCLLLGLTTDQARRTHDGGSEAIRAA